MSEKKYRITMTEEQMRITSLALESFFRLRYGQEMDFSDEMAAIEVDLSPDNPKHKEIFDAYIQRRDHLMEVLRCFFRIAFEPHGYLQGKPDECVEAETIWDAIRCARGCGRYNEPFQVGREPVPEIEVIEE